MIRLAKCVYNHNVLRSQICQHSTRTEADVCYIVSVGVPAGQPPLGGRGWLPGRRGLLPGLSALVPVRGYRPKGAA